MIFLQALLDLHKSRDLSNGRLCVKFVGVWEATDQLCEGVARELEKRGVIRREPPIAYAACLQQMSEADALLIIQPDSPLQVPGKIYEYVATRRPLVLIGGEGATANLVQQHQLGLVCPNDRGSIRHLLLELVKGSRSLPFPLPGEVERFNYRTLTADLARVFDEVHREHYA